MLSYRHTVKTECPKVLRAPQKLLIMLLFGPSASDDLLTGRNHAASLAISAGRCVVSSDRIRLQTE